MHSAVFIYNAALNRPAYQSSVYSDSRGNFSANLANDGDRYNTAATRDDVPTCVHSRRDTNPWWAVDLGRQTAVYRVDLTIRYVQGMKKCMLVSHYRVYTRGDRRRNRSLRSAPTIASCKHAVIVLCYVTAVLVFWR